MSADASIEQLAEAVRSADVIQTPLAELEAFTGVVDISPADMIATVRSGTELAEFQSELRSRGLSLPLSSQAQSPWEHGRFSRIFELLDSNLPHVLEAQHGSWRDWVLEMKLVLADGTTVKSGAKVVKNVAGYDAHKLFIGALGSLGIIAEVTLRVVPTRSIGPPDIHRPEGQWSEPDAVQFIQRVLPADLPAALAGAENVHLVDRATSTVWHTSERFARFEGDWVRDRGGRGVGLDETLQQAMLRTKQIFDPTGKLNPGVWGFM